LKHLNCFKHFAGIIGIVTIYIFATNDTFRLGIWSNREEYFWN